MPLFTSPEAPSLLSCAITASIDGPVTVTLSMVNGAGQPVPSHSLTASIEGNCQLVGRLVESYVCGWEAGAPTPFVVAGVERILRVNQSRYARH
jgi:hypothetical protein